MADENWTEEELLAAVRAYIDMKSDIQSGRRVNKAAVYRELAKNSNRTPKSFELRLQNISAVYSYMGRPWLPGLMPARNVGTNVTKTIERLILQEEGSAAFPEAVFNSEVLKLLKKPFSSPPSGNQTPARSPTTSSGFERDPKVVAYVLQQADGSCESCGLDAPFSKPNGLPYLEVHHVRWLSNRGSDTVQNSVAVCPNCHQELHYGAEQDQRKENLYKLVARLVRE